MYYYCYYINITISIQTKSGINMFSVVNVCTSFSLNICTFNPSHYLQMTWSYNMKSSPTSNDIQMQRSFAGEFHTRFLGIRWVVKLQKWFFYIVFFINLHFYVCRPSFSTKTYLQRWTLQSTQRILLANKYKRIFIKIRYWNTQKTVSLLCVSVSNWSQWVKCGKNTITYLLQKLLVKWAPCLCVIAFILK